MPTPPISFSIDSGSHPTRRSSRSRPTTAAGPRCPPPSSTPRSSPSRRVSSPPASSRASKIGFICRTRYEWTLIDFATWFAGADPGAHLRDLLPHPDRLEPDRLRRDRPHRRDAPSTSRASTRSDPSCAQVTKVWQLGLGDLAKLDGSGRRRHGCRDRATTQRRARQRHRHPHLHLGINRSAEGLHPHPLQLRRAVPQRRGRDAGGRVGRGRIHPAVHHDGARLRPLHLGARRARPG